MSNGVAVRVPVAVRVAVTVCVGTGVLVRVAVRDAVRVGVPVRLAVGVRVAVPAGVAVDVAVPVAVAVGLLVGVSSWARPALTDSRRAAAASAESGRIWGMTSGRVCLPYLSRRDVTSRAFAPDQAPIISAAKRSIAG